MEFGKEAWKDFNEGIRKEWLLTNGIGGFASSTVINANARRYHGLLVASLRPPVRRHLTLAKIDESLIIGDEKYDLSAAKTSDGYVMQGYHYLQRAVFNPLPNFIYNVKDVFVEKKIGMVQGENTVVILYKIINGSEHSKLKLFPLVNFRDYHFDSSSRYLKFKKKGQGNRVTVSPEYYDINIDMYCSDSSFTDLDNCYFYNMFYPYEQERGLTSSEDHYIPGYFEVEVKPHEERTITFIATVEDKIKCFDGAALIKAEEERLSGLLDTAGYRDELARQLVLSADSFIVYRKSTDAKTIIAGYPWFTDWGRDTMIALPGLSLVTKRFGDAKEILYTFSKYVKDGLLPNMFPDEGQEPAYNSVDAALWYFEAVNKYLKYTKDFEFVREHVYSVMREIIVYFKKGTLFNIKMDTDYLLSAGEEGTQLTWMDAKVGGWVVTPRHGKAVEINALWYNAVETMTWISKELNIDNADYKSMAERIKASFEKSFWNEEKQCLYDVISDEGKDGKVRPNQILSVSLSYPVVQGDMAKKIVDKVWKELYTAYGLRSLSPYDKEYRGIYIGDQFGRDSAYHQGTVWTWPMGHFITAFLRAHGSSKEQKEMAIRFIKPFEDHLRNACIGSISEIFDGNDPLIPRGCFAQAWSVGEILRAYVEDIGID